MILLISTCREKLSDGEFLGPVKRVVKDCVVKHFSEVDKVDDYDKIIICGTSLQDNECFEDIEKFLWLTTTTKPVLGICAGMQVMALTFGGVLLDSFEVGMIEIETLKENDLFRGTFSVYSLHSSGVNVSNDFDVIAKSATTAHGIKHKEKPLYGLLFHPEVRNHEIIQNFINM
jgi:GMP synthase-like glutamine amidotransferase